VRIVSFLQKTVFRLIVIANNRFVTLIEKSAMKQSAAGCHCFVASFHAMTMSREKACCKDITNNLISSIAIFIHHAFFP
jgi:hypothetical protein